MPTQPAIAAPVVYRFLVPSLNRDRRPIAESRREAFLRAIEGRSAAVNGGFVRFESCRACYRSDIRTMDLEDVTVIETRGRNPFSADELAVFADVLEQDRLYVQEAGTCRAYPEDESPEEPNPLCRSIPESREIVKLAKEKVGIPATYRFVQRLFDPHWKPIFSTTISDTEIDQMICEGNRVVERMVSQAGR